MKELNAKKQKLSFFTWIKFVSSHAICRYDSPEKAVVGLINKKQECIPVGSVQSAAVAMSIPACTGQGGVYPRGVSAQRGCLPGGCIPACTEADTPLWTEWLTDRCKNITFPQLRLRMVINGAKTAQLTASVWPFLVCSSWSRTNYFWLQISWVRKL